ncbi:hypothetical protein EJ07DRAFT_157031 [Lizonia empirigonia]|nr:hypothetical protein EJ07DRAFT_157031 [Lizonia empirigonia]
MQPPDAQQLCTCLSCTSTAPCAPSAATPYDSQIEAAEHHYLQESSGSARSRMQMQYVLYRTSSGQASSCPSLTSTVFYGLSIYYRDILWCSSNLISAINVRYLNLLGNMMLRPRRVVVVGGADELAEGSPPTRSSTTVATGSSDSCKDLETLILCLLLFLDNCRSSWSCFASSRSTAARLFSRAFTAAASSRLTLAAIRPNRHSSCSCCLSCF